MIELLTGKIIKKNPSFLVIDVHDVGLKVNITSNCYDKLPELNKKITLLIYFQVSENKFELYGFLDEIEKDLFNMLIGVSGIGPKTAINMLAAVSPSDFKNRLIAGEVKMLTSLPGIGPKTARRIIVELKDKFGEFDKNELPLEDSPSNNDAFQALKNLGFSPNTIREVINKVLSENSNMNTENIIKESLKILK
tara:strand:- start:413 stop:994 length:582 start_codon:yes stop_codon:yes gene_type:complete